MAVNRHITGTAHQGGTFTAGKIPTITLIISMVDVMVSPFPSIVEEALFLLYSVSVLWII